MTAFGERMMRRIVISICLVAVFSGCISSITGNPRLTGKNIAIADLPGVVRTSVRQSFPGSYIIRASVIEVAPHPPSYLVRVRHIKGGTSLLELSSTGHIGKEITEPES
jgi:hypothetical protein